MFTVQEPSEAHLKVYDEMLIKARELIVHYMEDGRVDFLNQMVMLHNVFSKMVGGLEQSILIMYGDEELRQKLVQLLENQRAINIQVGRETVFEKAEEKKNPPAKG